MADVEIQSLSYPMPPRPEPDEMEEPASAEDATVTETLYVRPVDNGPKKRGRPKGSKLCPVCRKMIRPGVEHVCSGSGGSVSSSTVAVSQVPVIDPAFAQSFSLVKNVFTIAEVRFGEVWSVSDAEINSIADPLAKLLPVTNDPTTALIIACTLVIGPRAYATYRSESAKKDVPALSGEGTNVAS
jgi:hypothetical protein